MRLKDEITNMDRDDLLVQKNREINTKQGVAFITGFNTQYKEFEHIFKKYWPILKEDHVLTQLLANIPTFIYRRAPSLRHHLVHNVFDPPKMVNIFPELKVFFINAKGVWHVE